MMNNECLLCLSLNECPEHFGSSSSRDIHSFRKGHIIYRQDNPNNHVYYILQGIIKIYTICESGKQIIHKLLPAGELLGISSLNDAKYASYSAEVLVDAKVYILEKSTVLDLFVSRPVFAQRVLKQIIKAKEDAYLRQYQLINLNVRQRMARCLLDLSKIFGEITNKGLKIKLPLSREELASIVGIAPETAIRLVSDFKNNRLINEENHEIIIIDDQALESEYQKKT